MLEISYPAVFRPDEDGRPVIAFPDLPEAHTDGKDMVEAMEEAQDCVGSVLAFRLAGKEMIPYPSKAKRGQRMVPVPLWIAPKLALYWAMKERGINNSELARKLGVRETVIRRMLDPDHSTKAEKIQAALEALGKRFLVAIEDAA
jgi:antitoxin HicB